MTDNSAPGVYTQPGSDADDVLGHRFAADAQPDFRALDKKAAHDDDDVEGHRIAAFDKAAAHDDEDDVEGHRFKAADRAAAQDGDGGAPGFRAL